jgi:hypothetical protein
MIVPVARIEARTTPRTTRADVQASLLSGPPVACVIWEVPGSRETSWLVQVPRELVTDQLRRFASLHIAADVVGFRGMESYDPIGDRDRSTDRAIRRTA